MSEGCKILQVVKVNVELVNERHFPGFEVATGPPAEVMGGRKIPVTGVGSAGFCSS